VLALLLDGGQLGLELELGIQHPAVFLLLRLPLLVVFLGELLLLVQLGLRRRREIGLAAHQQRVDITVQLFRCGGEFFVLALERLDGATDGRRRILDRIQVPLGLADVLIHDLD